MKNEINWIEIIIDEPEKTPLWMRIVGVSEDGNIYIPSSIAFEDELNVALNASNSDVLFVLHRNHAYYSSTWIAKNYPRSIELVTGLEKFIKDRL